MLYTKSMRGVWIVLFFVFLGVAGAFCQDDLSARLVNQYFHRKVVINYMIIEGLGFDLKQSVIERVIVAAREAPVTSKSVSAKEWLSKDLEMLVKDNGTVILLMDRDGHVAYNHQVRTFSRAERMKMFSFLDSIIPWGNNGANKDAKEEPHSSGSSHR